MPKSMAAPAPLVPPTANGPARLRGALGGIFGNGHAPARPPVLPGSSNPGRRSGPAAESFCRPSPPMPARHVHPEAPKLGLEVMRLENLVKKLHSELAAEREYTRALEAHVRTLQEND